MAPGEATGLCATHQSHLTELLTEERLLREAPKWCLLSAPSPVSLFWESLHRFKLLPCSSCGGYRVPWALEPPSWMGGCPNNWVATAPEA